MNTGSVSGIYMEQNLAINMMGSQTHLGWKRLLRSSSPTVNPTLPRNRMSFRGTETPQVSQDKVNLKMFFFPIFPTQCLFTNLWEFHFFDSSYVLGTAPVAVHPWGKLPKIAHVIHAGAGTGMGRRKPPSSCPKGENPVLFLLHRLRAVFIQLLPGEMWVSCIPSLMRGIPCAPFIFRISIWCPLG